MSKISKELKNVLDENIDFNKIVEDIYREYMEKLYDVLTNEDIFKPLRQLEDTRRFSIGKPVYQLRENGIDTNLKIHVSLDTYDNIEEIFVLELNGISGTYVYFDYDKISNLGIHGTSIDRVEDDVDTLHPLLVTFRNDITFIENLRNY